MRIFLSLLGFFLSNSTAHDIIYKLMALTSVPRYFLFFSIFLLFCFSCYFSICQIKANYFKLNITKIEMSFHLSFCELSIVLSLTVLPTLWKFLLFFFLLCSILPSPLSRCLIYLCIILEWKEENLNVISQSPFWAINVTKRMVEYVSHCCWNVFFTNFLLVKLHEFGAYCISSVNNILLPLCFHLSKIFLSDFFAYLMEKYVF